MKKIQRTLTLCIFYLFFFSFISLSEATICKPKSTFSLDCNMCRCSENGLLYSCTNDKCPPPNPGRFIEESLENGYVLLRPKSEKSENDEFVLRRKLRQDDPLASYLNDEIPISNENLNFNNILKGINDEEKQNGDNDRNADDFFIDNNNNYGDDNSVDPEYNINK